MSPKRWRIHYHSDSPFFAGSENMLVNFLQSPLLSEYFELSFSYRQTPIYEEGLKRRIPQLPPTFPLKLWDYPDYAKKIRARFGRWPAFFLLSCLNLVGIKFWFILRNTLSIFWALKNQKLDLVHINNGGFPGAPSCHSMAFAARLLGVRHVIYVVNNQAVPYQSLSRKTEWPLDLILCSCVSLFVTGSRNSAQKLKMVLHLPYPQLCSVHNGIRLRQADLLREEFLLSQGILLEQGRLIFGTVALFERRKGHHVLLQAIKILKEKQLPQLPLFAWEGDGPELLRIQQMVAEAGLSDAILFLPKLKNVFDFLNTMDVLILPSVDNEDFPNIILEAMGMAKPVISTILAGIPEQVDHGKTGLLCNPGSPFELAEAMEILVKNNQLRENMGQEGKTKFEENFKSEISVAKYRKIYLDLVQKGGAS